MKMNLSGDKYPRSQFVNPGRYPTAVSRAILVLNKTTSEFETDTF